MSKKKKQQQQESDCGMGNAAFCKFHPGVCDACRRLSESGEAARWMELRMRSPVKDGPR